MIIVDLIDDILALVRPGDQWFSKFILYIKPSLTIGRKTRKIKALPKQ